MYLEKTITKNRVTDLVTEVRQLRSSIIGLLGRDDEGEYQPEFVERVLRNNRQRPTQKFTTPQAFLRSLKGV